jgi:hypothetical protein
VCRRDVPVELSGCPGEPNGGRRGDQVLRPTEATQAPNISVETGKALEVREIGGLDEAILWARRR